MTIINVIKCPICGEQYNQRKICMHLWNAHKIKYKEYVTEHGELEIVGTEEVADMKKKEPKKEVKETVSEIKVEAKQPVEHIIKETPKKTIPTFDNYDRMDVSQISNLNKSENMGLSSWVEGETDNLVINEWC